MSVDHGCKDASGKPTVDAKPWRVTLVLARWLSLLMSSYLMPTPLFAIHFEGLGAGVQAPRVSALAAALAGTVTAPAMGLLAGHLG